MTFQSKETNPGTGGGKIALLSFDQGEETLKMPISVICTGNAEDGFSLVDAAHAFPVSIEGSTTVTVGNTSLAVTGPLTDTQLRATAVPISGTITVANIASTVSIGNFPSTQAVSGTVNIGNLPSTQAVSGTITVANIATTVSVGNTVAVTGPLTDTQLRASAVPISASALPLPSGAATQALQSTGNTKLDSVIAKLTTDASTNYLYVRLTDGTNPYNASGGGGSSTVSIDNFPSTQAVSGTIDIGNFPSTQVISGTVTVDNIATGAATEAKQDDEIFLLDAINDNLTTDASTKYLYVRLTDGTSPYTAGGGGSSTVSIDNFPSSQTVSGTITVDNIATTVSVSNTVAVSGALTDTELRATALTVSDNHTTAASPLSVRLSDGTGFYDASGGGGGATDSTATGTINANGQEVLLSNMNGINAVSIQVAGTYSGTLAVQIKHASGDAWTTISGTNSTYSNAGTYSAGGNWSPGTTGVFSTYCHGAAFMRITSTAWTSGTATISLRANGAGPLPILGAIPTGSSVIGSVSQNSTWNLGSIQTSIVPGTAATNLGKAEDAAHASGDTGVAIWGVRRDSLGISYPTNANGRYSQISVDRQGAVYTANCNSNKVTTSVAVTFTPAASATDILTIRGMPGILTYIARITISGVQTTAGHVLFALIRRNGIGAGGTFTTPTQVTTDFNDAVSNAVIRAFTANPTVGGTVGYLRQTRHFIPAAATAVAAPPLVWEAGQSGKDISVNDSGEIAISLEGATIAGGSLTITVEYYYG
jgi:hypothetical protein